MMTLSEFLEMCIAEDEKTARGALESTGGRNWESEKFYDDLYGVDLRTVWKDSFDYMPDEMYESEAQKCTGLQAQIANHVALFDPVRVLAEVAAKRALIALNGNLVIKHGQFESYTRSGDMVQVTIRAGRHIFAGDAFYPPEYEYITWDQFVEKYTEPNETLKAIAAIYKDHPAYDPEWSVS